MASKHPFEDTFLIKLVSIYIKSSDFRIVLSKMLASQEGVNAAMSLRGEDALILVDILDQAFEARDMPLDLRKMSVRILRKVCGSQSILPRSCVLSGDISTEGDTAFASGGFADIWRGRHNGNPVRIKAFRTEPTENLSKAKQCLFKEVAIWRRLSHPNVLPVLGVPPELFPMSVATEWMIYGNIVDFVSTHHEANRLRLLAEVASGLEHLHSIEIIHGNLKPANILIDRDFRPRLADYGTIRMLDTETPDHTPFPSFEGDIQYIAPELLDPATFGLPDRKPTRKGDIYAFGMVSYQVITMQQPFSGVKDRTNIHGIILGWRPSCPSDPNEWLLDNVWDIVSKCWSPLWGGRPDASTVMNVLNGAADAFEAQNHWEAELTDFLRTCKTGIDKKLEEERAKEFADKLDVALDKKGLPNEKRKQHLKNLRKLCCTFEILPSSFTLVPTFDEHQTTPFAMGGFSDVYEATLEGHRVAVKTLRITKAGGFDAVREPLIKEVVGWKWLRHENILPFIGVLSNPPFFSIISERMENGSITSFVRAYPNHNRLHLLSGAATGLVYLHEQGIVHGDLKGDNILVDSERCARLADFGLAVINDETTTGSAADYHGMKGTIRWMAPELLLPENFGFTGKLRKQLPSQSTDIYAIGMTILEVITGCSPFSDIRNIGTVMCKVLKGDRPGRPLSGFSDPLWELLVATWVVEDGPESRRRPPAPTVLDRVKSEVDRWDASILPLLPEWRQENTASSDGTNPQTTVNGPHLPFQMVAEHRLCTHEVAPLPDIPRHDHHSSPPREVLPALAPTPMVRSRAAEEPKNFEDAVRRIDEIAEALESGRVRSKGKAIIELRALCGKHRTVPTTYQLNGVGREGIYPYRVSHMAEIWKGKYKGEEVALKVLRVSRDNPDVMKAKSRFCKEVVLMKQGEHDNILPFYGVSADTLDFCLVFPWYKHGNIMEYLKENPTVNRYELLLDAVNGLRYLHNHLVVHGALQPSNILVDDDGNARLAMAGRSSLIPEPNTLSAGHLSSLEEDLDGCRYSAPELQCPEYYGMEKVVITKESDVYGMAMVIYEVLTGKRPYHDCDWNVIIFKIQSGETPERPAGAMTNQIWELLEKNWSRFPEKRPSTQELYNTLSNPSRHPQVSPTPQGQPIIGELPGRLKLQFRGIKFSPRQPKHQLYVKLKYGNKDYTTSPTDFVAGSGEQTWKNPESWMIETNRQCHGQSVSLEVYLKMGVFKKDRTYGTGNFSLLNRVGKDFSVELVTQDGNRLGALKVRLVSL